MTALLDRIAAELAPHGLAVRGGFHPDDGDAVPTLANGAAARTLVLVGTIGGGMWAAFEQARPHLPADDPLDTWSRRTITAVAATLGGHALFPFGGPPFLPFQRWARRAEPVAPSPLGILIHPTYGLWHAYRGAVAFAEPHPLPDSVVAPSPCATCRDRPCLSSCPVDAFRGAGYDVAACTGHLDTSAGGPCREGACLARRACPIGREFTYGAEQAAFHMAAFRAVRRGS